jgi:coproporphyrinogen III oxidase-like Fe-S oxidoreductase
LTDRSSTLLPDTGEPGFGVYIHWPFCAAKCPYCDFNSHVRHQPVDQARFVQAFLTEMKTMRALSGPKTVTSVFMGGGTPSLMDPSTVGAILDGIASTRPIHRASRRHAFTAIGPPASIACRWVCRR